MSAPRRSSAARWTLTAVLLLACTPTAGPATATAAPGTPPGKTTPDTAASPERAPPAAGGRADAGPTADRLFQVRDVDDDGGLVGTVAVDASSRLRVVGDAGAERLSKLAEETNAQQVMHLDAPCGHSAPTFALCSRILVRTEPEFLDAMRDHIKTYHGLDLTPQ